MSVPNTPGVLIPAFDFFCFFSSFSVTFLFFLFRSTSYDDDTIDTSHIQSSRMYTQLLLLLAIELSINTIETFFTKNYCSGNFDSMEQRIVSFTHTCELLREMNLKSQLSSDARSF